MTRMDSVRAAMVAIRSSGQMMVEIIEAGTTIPPIPSPARTRSPHILSRLSGVDMAREPVPAVMRTEEMIRSSLLRPRRTERSQSTMQAPSRMEKPMGKPRRPTPTGEWS